MDQTEAPQLPEIHHVTEGWHNLSSDAVVGQDSTPRPARARLLGRVCEHWVSYDAPAAVPVQDREGRTVMAGPGHVRSYIGLVLEIGDAQLQVRGRLRLGADRLSIEVD